MSNKIQHAIHELKLALKDKKRDYEEIFWESAKEIINNYKLNVTINNDTVEYYITELEFYFFDSKCHPDPYVHKHCLQSKTGEFYIHETSLMRGGIDITFGDETYFGGILIRGIQDMNGHFYPGPAKSLNELIKKFENKELSYHDVQLVSKNIFSLVQIDEPSNFTILRSIRYGLDKSFCDPTYEFLTKLYRFARHEEYFYEKIPDKTKFLICSHSIVPNINATSQKATINEWKKSSEADHIEPSGVIWNKIKKNFEV